MPRRGLGRLVVVLAFTLALAAPSTVGQNLVDPSRAKGRTSSSATASDHAASSLGAVPGVYVAPEFIGLYRPDGKFTNGKRLAHSSAQPPSWDAVRRAEVPANINLAPSESVIEDYEPPQHAVRPAQGRSLFAGLRDGLVTLAYGREKVLRAPTHVTTDSRRRLIVTDPSMPAVHVLDIERKKSFRIAGGPQHRLRSPTGLAVDADDNIYVADGRRGVIVVYDPQGRFLRYVGYFRGESLFQSPAAIAIDRERKRLYVVDPPVQQLTMLDLDGTVLKRVGSKRGPTTTTSPDHPTEIAVGNDQVVILDSGGSRIEVFDLECNFLQSFLIRGLGPPAVMEMGLAVDSASHIYVSNLNGSTLRAYSGDGRMIGGFGHQGTNIAEFNGPSGLWIDGSGRMYVADTRNSRVQIFDVSNSEDVRRMSAEGR